MQQIFQIEKNLDTGVRGEGITVGWVVKNEEEAILALRELMSNPVKPEKEGSIFQKYFEENHSVSKVISAYLEIF